MNVWYAAAIPLLLGIVPCLIVAVRGRIVDALVALEVATVLAVLVLLLIEQGIQRQTFFDVSLALAVLAFPSTLLLARVYRRWL
ncbi:MAG TPA: monovalent cation/H+ antiporter complex subunit F [Candidatus Sulfotelmatobacter sp.]|nr:monovalent cation/H+ antiporter complex subunit F [Candidatus Sulfotelmatobacter sp.]